MDEQSAHQTGFSAGAPADVRFDPIQQALGQPPQAAVQETAPFADQPIESYQQEQSSYPDQGHYSEPADDSPQQPAFQQPESEYLLLDWIADSRLRHKRSKEYYSSLAVIVALFSLILFFANQTLLIFVLLSFLFISYVLASVKPESVRHIISTYGIYHHGKLYYWNQVRRFWVQFKRGEPEIHVEIPALWANEVILLQSNAESPEPVDLADVADALSRYVVYEEPIPTQFDRWVQWIEDKFPLEPEEKTESTVPPQPEIPPQPSQPEQSGEQNFETPQR